MNKMKKIFFNVLLIILVLFITGCEKPTPENPDNPDGPVEDDGTKLLSFSQAQSC